MIFVLKYFTCQVYFIKTLPCVASSEIRSLRFVVYGILCCLISSRKYKAFHSASLLIVGRDSVVRLDYLYHVIQK